RASLAPAARASARRSRTNHSAKYRFMSMTPTPLGICASRRRRRAPDAERISPAGSARSRTGPAPLARARRSPCTQPGPRGRPSRDRRTGRESRAAIGPRAGAGRPARRSRPAPRESRRSRRPVAPIPRGGCSRGARGRAEPPPSARWEAARYPEPVLRGIRPCPSPPPSLTPRRGRCETASAALDGQGGEVRAAARAGNEPEGRGEIAGRQERDAPDGAARDVSARRQAILALLVALVVIERLPRDVRVARPDGVDALDGQ